MLCPNPECPDYEETGKPGEYVAGVTVCPVCGEYLVGVVPPELTTPGRRDASGDSRPVPMPDEELEPVLECTDPSEISIVKSLLDSEGIPYMTSGEEQFDPFRGSRSPSRYHPAAGLVRFLVPTSQAERARGVLTEIELEE